IVARTGYNFECTTGQRKYGGPPPNYDKSPPGPGTEVYVGKIPQDVMENELILLFEQVGTIYELRLMMNPQNSLNKGFCFITYCEKSEAQAAAETYNNYEIRPRKFIKVNVSIPNTRIYLGNLPKFKNKDQIFEEVSQYVEGLKDVIIYDIPDDPSKKNRGFAFLDFDSHKHASDAKKKLSSENMLVFNHTCVVDWADPQDEPNDEVMSKVKVLYIRNLKSNVLEQDLRTLFEPFGSLEKVKKIKDYAFVHYNEREAAMKALEHLNNTVC
ncbi:hypothetical protein HELRODRAFT_82058, partial [Helobdella robusta]|uniref:RRM domain-containing protein n=1 Tax=Helobdella robusta TaxID=6412 RepID=T1G4M3_HELRO